MRKFSENRALDHFDKAYSIVYGKKWNSIRAALLTKNKSVALVNNFADPEETSQELELSGAINLRSLIEQKQTEANEEASTKGHHVEDEEFIKGKSFLKIIRFHEHNLLHFQVF